MQNVRIQKIQQDDEVPWSLLTLADPSIEKIKRYIETGEIYIATIDGLIIGEYVLMPLPEKVAEIVNIAVDPQWQGKGVGKMLVLDAIQRVKNSSYTEIRIGTGNSSIRQIELYKKCGFSITAVDKGFFLRNYPEPIYENGVRCKDMVRMTLSF